MFALLLVLAKFAQTKVDDYIIASIELYLDVINLFLYLLQFLVASGGNN